MDDVSVDVVNDTTAVGPGGTETDSPSVSGVTNCAVGSSKDGTVVQDGTTARLPVGAQVPRVKQRCNGGVPVNGGDRTTHNPLGIGGDGCYHS